MRAHPGIRINYTSMANSAIMLGTLRAQRNAPEIDVMILDLTMAKPGSDEGLFEQIPRDSMPVLDELNQSRAFQPGAAGPAVTFDNLVLIYSPERINPAPDSWRVFWEPSSKGKVAITGVPDIGGISIVLMANKMAGVNDYLNFEKGIAEVAEMAPNVLTFDPSPDAYSMLINGLISLSHGWNARAQLYAKQSPGKIASVVPKEGSFAIMNIINLVKHAPQSDAAKIFIAYALSVEAQSAFAERMYYAPTNTRVVLSDQARERIPTQEEMASWTSIDWIKVAAIRDKLNEQWRRRVLTR